MAVRKNVMKKKTVARADAAQRLIVYMKTEHEHIELRRVAIVKVCSDGFEVESVSKTVKGCKENPWKGEQNGWRTSLEDAIVFGRADSTKFSAYITKIVGGRSLLARVRSQAYKEAVSKRRLADSI